MAALMATALDAEDIDLMVPVPLHWRRERSRGYNQSRELARQLSPLLGLPVEAKAARRTRATAPLAKTMHREERRRIVAGAFAARPEMVAGRNILLVDDVVTTGATLDACASALMDAGAKIVRCVTWARTG
jgi:ComF family protein